MQQQGESTPRPTWGGLKMSSMIKKKKKTIHLRKKSSNKNSLCVCWLCECLFYVCLCAHSGICAFFLTNQHGWMCSCVSVSSSIDLNVTVIVCFHVCWSVCASVYVSIYKLQSPTHPLGIQNLSHLRRGHSWRDWQRGLLAGCRLPVWNSRTDCSPGRSEMRRTLMSNR